MLYAMGPEDMRVGDGDREAAAERLKAALDEGRLDLHEYDERVQQAYTAKTYGDLNGLFADLPGPAPAAHSQVQPHQTGGSPESAAAGKEPARGLPGWVSSYAAVFIVCVIIWGITSASSGQWQYFWPVWMLIPLVFGIVGGWGGGSGRSRRRRDR
ncbi:DUF1707 SHOCT-like domain-containing protein [Mangrovihabitans endophyticus]|uniref:DUF1707 domain-containing protein n=1 Tax=Mangrovihabitans endophyticus TaxID=1751298 RepID=A0A8J3BYD4_9ACTN|nr:DUF1707 domain-containing protein [Mangrovihabitans endophyticus]GGK92787.1 hypothetical protein GCM10012284_28340 [Mangrovihabitans endophyticus]